MLSLCLYDVHLDPLMRRKLLGLVPHLGGQLELVVLDTSNDADTRAELHQCAAGRNMQVIVLDRALDDPADRAAAARQAAGFAYVLMLGPQDWVDPDQLPALATMLAATTPEVCVLGMAHWLGDPAVILPAPDAPRVAALLDPPEATDLLRLMPEPQRLLLRNGIATRTGAPMQDWQVWRDTLARTEAVAVFAPPVLRRPLPQHGAARALEAAGQTQIGNDPGLVLEWASDAFDLATARDATELLDAATALAGRLGQIGHTPPAPRALGAVITALEHKDAALALARIALSVAANSEAASQGMATELGRLRRDLDLALPGPDYLRALYDRIRAR